MPERGGMEWGGGGRGSGDKYFHRGFYDRRDQSSEEAALVRAPLSRYVLNADHRGCTRLRRY